VRWVAGAWAPGGVDGETPSRLTGRRERLDQSPAEFYSSQLFDLYRPLTTTLTNCISTNWIRLKLNLIETNNPSLLENTSRLLRVALLATLLLPPSIDVADHNISPPPPRQTARPRAGNPGGQLGRPQRSPTSSQQPASRSTKPRHATRHGEDWHARHVLT
jgi:hypothetical protein